MLEAEIAQFDQRFYIVEESRSTRDRLLSLLRQAVTGGKQVHDANIFATMLHYGIGRLLTHDVDDFRRFSTLIGIILLPDEPK